MRVPPVRTEQMMVQPHVQPALRTSSLWFLAKAINAFSVLHRVERGGGA